MTRFFEKIAYSIRQPKAERLDITDGNPDTSLDSWKFHIFEKTILHLALRFIRVPEPEKWPGIFTGPRKQMAEFLLQEYFPNERQPRRRLIMEKVIWYILKMWEYDTNYCEVAEYILWRLLERSDIIFDLDPANLNPDNWYTEKRDLLQGKSSRILPPEGYKVFTILRKQDNRLYVSIPLDKRVVSHWQGTGVDGYYILDIPGGNEGQVCSYPILFECSELLDLGPALRKLREEGKL